MEKRDLFFGRTVSHRMHSCYRLMNVALVRVSSAAFVFLELRERERDEKMIDYLFKHIKVDHSDFHLEIHQLS